MAKYRFFNLGQYLKLEVHECYNNRRNLFNKVALEAINIVGEHLPDEAALLADRYLKRADREHYAQHALSAGDAAEPHRMDAESDLIVERITSEKIAAEDKEDYDMAGVLKSCIDQVKTYGSGSRYESHLKILKTRFHCGISPF